MATYTSLSALLKDVQKKEVERVLNRVATDLMDLIQSYMLEYFYGKYTPLIYERTYQMLNAITMKKAITAGSTTTVEIYLDETAARYKNESSADVFKYSAEGFHGYYQSEYDYWEMAMDEIKATYKKYLIKNGLNVI